MANAMHYRLNDDHSVTPILDVYEWGYWFETADRRVARTYTENYHVSTVFLSLNHSWDDYAPPILFESMVFANEKGRDPLKIDQDWMDRYCTWDEARRGHSAMVKRLAALEIEACLNKRENDHA